MRASMEQLLLELGLPSVLFSQDYKWYGCLATASWAKHLWEFLHSYNIVLVGRGPVLHCSRLNDQFLMQSFRESGFRGKYLMALNRCRLYLQVTTISNITQGSGEHLTNWAWDGQRSPFYHSTYSWPAQGRPAPLDWNTWCRALTQSFGLCPSTQAFAHRVGHWLESPDAGIWFVSPSEYRLYVRQGTQWVYYPCVGGRLSRLC